MSSPQNNNRVQVVVIIAVAVIILALVAGFIGLYIFADSDRLDRIPLLITSILGVVTPTVIGLLAYLKVNTVHAELNNGQLKGNVKDALTEVIEDRNVNTGEIENG